MNDFAERMRNAIAIPEADVQQILDLQQRGQGPAAKDLRINKMFESIQRGLVELSAQLEDMRSPYGDTIQSDSTKG